MDERRDRKQAHTQRYHSILKPSFHTQASAFSLAPTAPAAKLQLGKGRAGSGRTAPLRMAAGSAMEKRIAQSENLMKYCDSVYTTQRRKTSTVTAGDGLSILLFLPLLHARMWICSIYMYIYANMYIDCCVSGGRSQDRIGTPDRAPDHDHRHDH